MRLRLQAQVVLSMVINEYSNIGTTRNELDKTENNNSLVEKNIKSSIFIKSLIWNMGGMCFYYLCRWLINISVVRMSVNYIDAGRLSLAISITNIWNVFALFSVRNIQVS